jgi:hypothetical protein
MDDFAAVPLRDLSEKERAVVERLGEAFNEFRELNEEAPAGHPDDLGEFKDAVHRAQNIVLARPAFMGLRDAATQAPGPTEDKAR